MNFGVILIHSVTHTHTRTSRITRIEALWPRTYDWREEVEKKLMKSHNVSSVIRRIIDIIRA